MKTKPEQYIDITEARYLSDYKLRLSFSDGTKRDVDFESFLRRARNPDLAQYRQLRKFKTFRIHHGNLMWGDYKMIFPILDLYQGEI